MDPAPYLKTMRPRSICNSLLVILLYASLSGSVGEDEVHILGPSPANKPGSCVQGGAAQGKTCTGHTTQGNTEGDTTQGNTCTGDTTQGDTEGDTTQGNAEGGRDTEGDTTQGNAERGRDTEGDTTQGNAEGDTTQWNTEGGTTQGNTEGGTTQGNTEEDDTTLEIKVTTLEEDVIEGDAIETQVAEVNYSFNFFKSAYDGLSTGVSNLYSTASSAKDRVYSYIDAYSEKVRKIVKNEFVYLIADGVADVLKRITSPGMYVLGFNVGLVLAAKN